ncbi:unnamed protein product [Trichogramma brassicae]|uniref:Retrotransposon gag domain-containing protein n=1 Tax=Trichogramma brassicae TaxID=86971 RepID=A0A6H5IU29_9HYME|nr:unnamed protein product [Trichogramma brassicae]
MKTIWMNGIKFFILLKKCYGALQNLTLVAMTTHGECYSWKSFKLGVECICAIQSSSRPQPAKCYRKQATTSTSRGVLQAANDVTRQATSQCHRSDLQVTARRARLEIAPSGRELIKTSRIFTWKEEHRDSLSNNEENNLIVYFKYLKETRKLSPSTLWSIWSMLRSTLSTNEDIDIKQFQRLKNLVKNNSKGYKPKKSSVFQWKEIMKFIEEAPDEQYLATKISLRFFWDRAGSSDMSLDQSAMLDNPLNSAIIENPGATGLEALVITMLEENRRRDRSRDETMERILNGLSRNLTFQDAQPTAAPLNYQVMPDLSKSIPVFTGSEDPTVAREWIENIRSMRVLHNWPEAFALETARIHLAQGARDWFSARRASLDTWPKFSAAFESTYLQHENMTTRWKRMTERVQLKGEHIQQYFHSKVKLCLKLNLDAAEIIEQVLIGLWSKDLFSAMSGRVHANVDALLHDIIEYEHKVGQRQERASPSSGKRGPEYVKKKLQRIPSDLSDGKTECPVSTCLRREPASRDPCRVDHSRITRPSSTSRKAIRSRFFQVDVPLTAPGLHLRARTDVTMLPNSINFIEIASSDGSCRVPATGNYPVSTRIKEGASIGRGEIAELPVLTIVPEKRPIKMEEIVIGEDASPRVAEELLALVYLNTQRTKNAQIVRWHHLLSEFDYEIVHREGAKLAHVDALSRAPMEYEFDKDPVDDSAIMSIWETNRNENCEIGVFIIIDDNQEILAFQFRDEEIEAKRKILNKPASQRSRDEKESLPSAFLVNLDEPTPLTFSTGLYATRSRVSTRYECVIVAIASMAEKRFFLRKKVPGTRGSIKKFEKIFFEFLVKF